jgi:N-acetyltransferase 10
MALLPGAFREFSPALALSLLDPKLAWAEAETQASVQSGVQIQRADGAPLSPYDLKRLQVSFSLVSPL